LPRAKAAPLNRQTKPTLNAELSRLAIKVADILLFVLWKGRSGALLFEARLLVQREISRHTEACCCSASLDYINLLRCRFEFDTTVSWVDYSELLRVLDLHSFTVY